MNQVIGFFDGTSRLLVDPSNKNFSSVEKGIAWIVTIAAAFATFGTIQIASAIWRRYRHIEEKNDTHEMINEVFKSILGKKEKETVSKDQLKHLFDALKYTGDGRVMKFEHEGSNYYAWYRANLQTINIQTASSFAINDPPSNKEKLGIKLDDTGNVTSVYVDGHPHNSTIPEERIPWLKNAYEASKSLTLQAPQIQPPQLTTVLPKDEMKQLKEYLKQNHSGESNKKTFYNKKLYVWYSNETQEINIQTTLGYSKGPNVGKLSIKLDDEGNLISVYVNGTDKNGIIPQYRSSWIKEAYEACKPQKVEQFLPSDLMTFRAALQRVKHSVDEPIVMMVDGTTYCVWYSTKYNTESINIQDYKNWQNGRQLNKMGVIIDDAGRITSLRINNKPQPEGSTIVPDEFLNRLQVCFKQALQLSSTYTNYDYQHQPDIPSIQVQLVRRGLKDIPEFHLQSISNSLLIGMLQVKDPKIKVSFLNDDMTFAEGTDAGGLSRDYMDDLFDGITKSNQLSFKTLKSSSLALPQTKNPYKEGESLPVLNVEEQEVYTNIGKLVMYCYHSEKVPGHWENTYFLGRHFDDALFKAALSLTAKEIDTPFEKLSLETKLKIGKALLESQIETGIDLKFHHQHLSWLSRYDSLNDTELMEASQAVVYAGYAPDELTEKGEGLVPDIEKIKQDKDSFKKYLIDLVFTPDYNYGQLGSQIAPIHAIAQGMKSFCHPDSDVLNDNNHWDVKIKNEKYVDFSTKVQGYIDRKEIASQIVMDRSRIGGFQAVSEIRKKVDWLKEWLIDEKKGASDEEVRLLLKFITGCSSFPRGKQITVISQVAKPYIPIPLAHTCSFEIELSPVKSFYGLDFKDDSKENFIKSIKEMALANPSAYSMI